MNIPNDRKYGASDEWVKMDGNIATIGVTDFAQNQLSDIVFFEAVVSVGEKITRGSAIATLESVKAAADVNAPVSGEVLEINEALSQSPELVNSSPYEDAWMFKVKISDPKELDNLMDTGAYTKHCEEQSH